MEQTSTYVCVCEHVCICTRAWRNACRLRVLVWECARGTASARLCARVRVIACRMARPRKPLFFSDFTTFDVQYRHFLKTHVSTSHNQGKTLNAPDHCQNIQNKYHGAERLSQSVTHQWGVQADFRVPDFRGCRQCCRVSNMSDVIFCDVTHRMR